MRRHATIDYKSTPLNSRKNRNQYLNNQRKKDRDEQIKLYRQYGKQVYNKLKNQDVYEEDTPTSSGNGYRSKIHVMYNRIYFTGPVTEESMGALNKTILDKNKEFEELEQKCSNIATLEPKPIYLWIQSYGGYVDPCMPVLDTIRNSKIPIYTVVNGYAASCGSLLSVVGKKRYMTASSTILIHQLSGGIRGTMENIRDGYQNTEETMERLYNVYEKHTQIPRKELEDYMTHDRWWGVEKCLELGLVDEIYDGV
jgi:ATP-dependent Clp endopeptidase proteolytic subunit ClpP